MLKYEDLHNKILRDAADPEKVAQELLDNGYYVVGVNAHNIGKDVKDKERFYKFFETHFELFAEKGLLMLPAVELKIRDENYSAVKPLCKEFSRKFIPIHHKGEVHHVPLMVFLHGGHKGANDFGCKEDKLDLLCHPLKDNGHFTVVEGKDAAAHNVGIEFNYREYIIAEDKDEHLDGYRELISVCKKTECKMFLFTATIKEEELTHIDKMIEYSHMLHEDLIHESLENVHELMVAKYGKLLEKLDYSLETLKKKHLR